MVAMRKLPDAQGRPLPPRVKQALDSRVLRMFTGDPTRFGFPQPAEVSSLPFGSTTFLTAIGSEGMPPAASVAKDRAISRGLTASTPSPIAK